LRDDYASFRNRGAEIIGIAPHDLDETRHLAESLSLPFPVLADARLTAFEAFGVTSRVWSLGQRPGLFIVDREGHVRFQHVGWQQWDIPSSARLLAVLEQLNREMPPASSPS